jgi:elongation factor G
VDDLLTGDTITHPGAAARLPVPKFPVPMVSLSVEPKSREHEQRLSTALARLADGEKTFTVTRDAQTGEMVVTGMSQFHIEVMLERMKRRYQVEVTTKTPKIPFRETITRPAEGHYRHKKQTGGRGQYGEVFLKIEPLERGAGFEFVDEIKGGKIPGQYLPAVEKGIREAAEKGVLAGYPVVDFRVRVYDGSYHEVDSSPESFKIAGSRAFKNAFAAAGPVLIEPIVNLEVFVPTQFMGDITGHLNQRRGRIMGIEAQGSLQVIRAQIPLMEVTNYAAELRAMTGGEGFYSIEFAGYDILPHRLAEGVIAQAKREEEQED